MPVRVALDVTALLGTVTGVGAMVGEVTRGLADRPDIDLCAFAVTWRGRELLPTVLPPGVRAVRRPMAARPLREAWLRTELPPVEWWTGPVDVVHGPNFVVPPARRAARVVTVHDLTCVHDPNLVTADARQYPPLIRRAVAHGATVHAVSQFVADEVHATFGVPTDRIAVVPNGVSPLPDGPGTDAARGRALAGLPGTDAGGSAGRYVLALGTIEPRKNLPVLVAAFDALAADRPELRLVVAGPDGWGLAAYEAAVARAHHADRIVRPGWVSTDDRAALLRGAAAFAYQSRYEGFGLPPLEAMAAGVPVVATTAGALPEVIGDAGVLVAPDDLAALAEGLATVLDDDARAASLVRAGHERVARYPWSATVGGLAALYHRLT